MASRVATLPLRSEKVGRPRLDPYTRLMSRFYEPLLLVKVLAQTRKQHSPGSPPENEDQRQRRELQTLLCYVCDFKPGGESCTAIGLQNDEHSYNYCVASNGSVEKIARFLESVLAILSDVSRDATQPSVERGDQLLRHCLQHALPRVKDNLVRLSRAVKSCTKILLQHGEDRDKNEQFALWLEGLISSKDTEDYFKSCHRAFDAARSPFMRRLRREKAAEDSAMSPSAQRKPFAIAFHHIGRLAYRVLANERLMNHAAKLEPLFENFQVHRIPYVVSVPKPVPDAKTSLDGLLNRMLRADDPERPLIRDELIRLNQLGEVNDQNGIFTQFMTSMSKCKPTVHAEIQVLEYFHARKMSFVGNDKYVACSKPACIACKLYFKYHPARMVMPPSHEKIWSNWSPPALGESSKQKKVFESQRNILNKMTQALRDMAISQILNSFRPAAWHSDSLTAMSSVQGAFDSSDEYVEEYESQQGDGSCASGNSGTMRSSPHGPGPTPNQKLYKWQGSEVGQFDDEIGGIGGIGGIVSQYSSGEDDDSDGGVPLHGSS